MSQTPRQVTHKSRCRWWWLEPWMLIRAALLVCVLGVLGACGQTNASSSPYGGPENHVHSLLVLQGMPNTVLLATHFGLYRSKDSGHTWVEIAGGPGQTMDGLMSYQLIQSQVDPRRLYVLGIPQSANQQAPAATGLYTSPNAGQTWQLAAPFSAFPTDAIDTISTGSATAGQLYAILPTLGPRSLYTSEDFGKHWHPLSTLPTANPSGIISDLHRLLLWSGTDGIFFSDDGGEHWQHAAGVEHGIYSLAFAGATIYANGDAGLYVSEDKGASFHLVNTTYVFNVVLPCAQTPRDAYGLTSTAIYITTDSGKIWHQTMPTSREPAGLAVDPTNANIAYVGFSYPLGVAVTTDGGTHWRSILP